MSKSARRRSRMLWALITLILLAAVAAAMWPRVQSVETVEVSIGPLRLERVDRGTTRIREIHVIAAPVPGQLERLELEAGDAVTAGQILARIRPVDSTPLDPRSAAEAQAALQLAQARLDQAQAAVAASSDRRQRLQTMHDNGWVSQGELITAISADREARAAQAAAQAALMQAQAAAAISHPDSSGLIELRAPTDGRILQRLTQGGVPVTTGTALLELGDPADLEVVAEFLSQDAVAMQVGALAWIEAWGGEPIAGRVVRVEPFAEMKISALGVEEQRVRVIIAPEQVPEQWGHGYQVDASVVIERRDEVLQLPIEALQRDGHGWLVWQVVDGRVQGRSVDVGASDGRVREVLSGVAEGDRVLRFPSTEDWEGRRVSSD